MANYVQLCHIKYMVNDTYHVTLNAWLTMYKHATSNAWLMTHMLQQMHG